MSSFISDQQSMASSASQLRLRRALIVLLAIFVVFYFLWPSRASSVVATSAGAGAGGSSGGVPRPQNAQRPQQAWTEQELREWDNLDVIKNETLGVEKVFAINLASRPDKRDNIILASAVTEFRVEWIDGVTPEEVSSKSYPYNWKFDHKPTEYAARRAHLNAIQRVVEERLGSAIIMEDDVDWDVSVKAQLQSFALAARALQDTKKQMTLSPYGDDWDILWLGHCGIECKTDEPFYLTPTDPTIPMPHHFLPYWRDSPVFEGHTRPDHSRLTCAASDGVCSTFYAVSNHGARKILAALSVNPSGLAEEIDIGAQFDVSLGRMCGHGYLRCYTSFPAIIGGFRAAGAKGKISDIHVEEGEDTEAFSFGVMYSTMLNINRLLRGERTVHATWDDAAVMDVIPSEITMKKGVKYSPGVPPPV